MFKIKYKLKIDNEEYESEHPSPSDVGHNIFILKGKNDSGKTTAISLIKLAFIGKNLDSIKGSPEYEKLEFLLKNTEFTATLNIASHNKDTKVDIEFSNAEGNNRGQIAGKYILNDREVGLTAVLDKIDVLYEVPSTPLDKLKNVLYRIKRDFDEYKEYCNRYKEDLQELYTKLHDYKSKEDKRQSIIEKIKELEGRLQSARNYCESLENKYKAAEDQFLSCKFKKLKSELVWLESEISKISIKETPPNEAISLQNQIDKKIREVKEWLTSLEIIIGNFVPKFANSFRKVLDKFDKIDIRNVATMNSKEIIDELITEIETIRLTMDTQIRTNENDKSIQFKLLNELRGLLKKYLNSNPPIPGLGERVGDFLLKLDEEAKQFNKIQGYEDTIAKLDKTKGLLQSLSTFVGQNRKALTSALTQSMSEGQALEQLESLKKKRDQVEKELSEIPPKYRDVDVNVPFDEAQQKYESLKKGLDDCRQICEGINVELNTQRSLLKEYSALSKPSTTLTLQEIKSKINKLETIMSRLSEYAKYISFLIEGRPIAEGQEFYGALGEYLAVGLIREIYHNHHTYPIKQINLIERFYVSESGEVIHFDTIGSGTSALNSILMKIKQTDNKKKIIALIDEISAMDDENFKTFLEDVKAYTTDGRLLLTIMTRPDSSVDKAVCEPVKLGDSFDRIRTT